MDPESRKSAMRRMRAASGRSTKFKTKMVQGQIVRVPDEPSAVPGVSAFNTREKRRQINTLSDLNKNRKPFFYYDVSDLNGTSHDDVAREAEEILGWFLICISFLVITYFVSSAIQNMHLSKIHRELNHLNKTFKSRYELKPDASSFKSQPQKTLRTRTRNVCTTTE